MKMRIIVRRIKTKTRGIDMKKGHWRMYDTNVFGVHIIRSFHVHMI